MYHIHPEATVGRKAIRPTRRQVRAMARKSSRNSANWRHMADASRYTFEITTRYR